MSQAGRVSPRLSVGFAGLSLAEFSGSFCDQAFLMLPLAVGWGQGLGTMEARFALLLAGYVVPFLLLAPLAGYAADRFDKRRVIVWSRLLQLAVLSWAGCLPLPVSVSGLLALAAMLGVAAALFGPARYGVIPALLGHRELSRGNGVLVTARFVGLGLGVATSGYLAAAVGWHATCRLLAGLALLGLVASVQIPSVAAVGRPGLPGWHLVRAVWQMSRPVRQCRPLALSVLGVAYFWLVLSLFRQTIPVYARGVLGLDSAGGGLLLGAAAVGVALGGLLVACLSAGNVELGLVPLGAVGLVLGSLALFWSWPHPFGSAVVLIGLVGLSAGLFWVPLLAYLQWRSPRGRIGAVFATSQMLSAGAMLLAAALYWLLAVSLQPATLSRVAGRGMFLATVVATLAVTGYVCWLLPVFLFRFLLWLGTHSLYRVRVLGRENVPERGPALLVCNHISYADGLFITAAHHRHIRFVVWSELAALPHWRWLGRIMGVIPISASAGPKALARALREARDALRRGQLVCIFAEGQISRTGNMLRFKRGFEKVVTGVEAPIIPTFLDCVWGSIFSFQGGKFFWKWPRQIPHPVTVAFGKRLPPTAEAFRVQQAVQETGAECVRARKDTQKPLHRLFVRRAARHPWRFCMADSTGTELSYGKALAAVAALSRVLKRRLGDDEQMVGLLLPPSVAGSLTNLGVLAAGKVPVNLNYTGSSEALASCIEQCGIRTVISSPAVLKRLRLSLPLEPTPVEELRRQVTILDKLLGLLGAYILPGWATEYCLMRLGNSTVDQLVTVIFSSGSTGEPKGVMLSHHNVLSNAEAVIQVIDPTPQDRLVGVLPLFHSFGFLANLWVPFLVGCGAVYHFNPLEAKEVGELAQKYRGSILLATPTFLRAYTRRVRPEQFRHLRLILAGAEKLPPEVAESFQRKFGVLPLEGYGCTELSPVVAVNVPDFVGADGRQIGNKPGTVGHPIPGVAVRVVDPDTWQELPPEQDGLLLVKGPNVMQGYLGRPELTAQAIRDGWYVTGDVARLDEDGFITITDRLARFSKIGGEMVPHVRIEQAIHQIVGGDDQVAVVVGVPDRSKGERLVVLHRELPISTDELWRKLQQSGLPKLWVPARDSFLPVPEFPYLGSGKLDLRAIRQIALARLGIQT